MDVCNIINGDCLEVMRSMEANSISCIVTDPPYGLSFMGKGWDHAVPNVDYWKEALRVCKPGGFLLAMGGTRTFHRLTCAIEDAGFQIRDCISWLYGSGFPKSHNHFGIEGYGTALKPAWEPCIVAMKPCDGTFKQNAEKWGQAGINIDGCRVGEEQRFNSPTTKGKTAALGSFENCNGIGSTVKGRWPANVILDEKAGAMLDEQSGVLKSGSGDKHSKTQLGGYQGGFKPLYGLCNYDSDSGGASRFFYCAKASSRERNPGMNQKEPSLLSMENSDDEPSKNHQRTNNHPTVKPQKLMQYLIKLVMPPKDGILLDPFSGSGSTILAAYKLGCKAIGIELSPEYCEIARARLKNAETESEQLPQQMDLFEKNG